jgi:hypothetical protein
MSSSGEPLTVAGLIAFVDWLGSRGEMNASTAKAYSSAVLKVMEIEVEGWQNIDVGALDVDDQADRFARLRGMNYKTDSVGTYQTRFKKAVELYLAYTGEGAPGLKALLKERGRRTPQEGKKAGNGGQPAAAPVSVRPDSLRSTGLHTASSRGAGSVSAPDEMTVYPFPVRFGVMAYVHLPHDFSKADAKRLCAFVESIALDTPQSASVTGQSLGPTDVDD